jgi:CRISPR-associated protein Csm1
MSVQIFLQGRLVGIEHFLLGADSDMDGRSHWVSLLTEVLPRAVLAELNLSKMLLGTSGGEQFLLVLPEEARERAEQILSGAARQISDVSGCALTLAWAITENLGDWSIVRKRLSDAMELSLGTPLAGGDPPFFEPYDIRPAAEISEYFTAQLGRKLRESGSVGWSPDNPGLIVPVKAKHTWALGTTADGLSYARHAAPDDDGDVASLQTLASRAEGRKIWGVLRGDVDRIGVRLRRAQNIEEHVQISVLFKQFFAGELSVLCSVPEFWRKVTLLYSGGDDFAIYGAWDALIGIAREIQRLFHRFTEQSLKDYPGPEGKTITMGLALARDTDSPLSSVFEEAGRNLEIAKSSGKDTIHLLGRTLEWKQLSDAAETKEIMARLIRDFGASPQFLYELASFYRDGKPGAAGGRSRNDRVERPWRFHRRLNLVLGNSRSKEFQRLRGELISDFTGRKAAHIRLRPQGRVALEWARLETEA